MATSAEEAVRAAIAPSNPLPMPRFLCGCRDCAFRREELRLAGDEHLDSAPKLLNTGLKIMICEEA